MVYSANDLQVNNMSDVLVMLSRVMFRRRTLAARTENPERPVFKTAKSPEHRPRSPFLALQVALRVDERVISVLYSYEECIFVRASILTFQAEACLPAIWKPGRCR